MQAAMSLVHDRSASARRDNIVEVRGLSKFYGGFQALKEIDLDFPEGELISLLGPSGCGKTTLLKMIAGLLEPTAGQVFVKGKAVTGPGPERAVVFQAKHQRAGAHRELLVAAGQE